MKILISESQIAEGVAQLGQRLSTEYAGKTLTIIGVLTGSIILLADLIRQIHIPLKVGLIQASSYRGQSTEPAHLTVDFNTGHLPQLIGQDVLLIDDIFDTGQTLNAILNRIDNEAPASLKSAVLLKKQGRAVVDLQPDFHIFEIPDCFVVGYGLDYNNQFRHLPNIAQLEQNELAAYH